MYKDNNIIPLTGRIAIIDDNIYEAKPLMREFSKNNIPYVYIKGDDPSFFPDQPDNDIRILFLDINLLGQSPTDYKNIKSNLINVIRKVISPNNYPYVLIYWSLQEREYDSIIREAFDTVLIDRRPISIHRFVKPDFFSLPGGEEQPTDKDIIEELKKIIQSIPAYSYLMQWENIAHCSTDELLKDIFPNTEPKEWENVTNIIINSLGQAYIGQYFSDASFEEKINASLLALNMVFVDSLDNHMVLCGISNPQELSSKDFDKQRIEELKAVLNHKLLVYTSPNNICEPGVVIQYSDPAKDYFEQFLHKVLSVFSVKHEILCKTPDILDSLLKKELNNRIKQIKQEIRQTWMKIGIVVTPSCDFAQKKKICDRVVQGVIIESRFADYINQGDAFYTSPIIRYGDKNYIIVLNFNYFITTNLDNDPNCNKLFKIRRPMLAEIQSKLARHINRQGIMNL